jgi:ubiquitin C-terminal hydrolase
VEDANGSATEPMLVICLVQSKKQKTQNIAEGGGPIQNTNGLEPMQLEATAAGAPGTAAAAAPTGDTMEAGNRESCDDQTLCAQMREAREQLPGQPLSAAVVALVRGYIAVDPPPFDFERSLTPALACELVELLIASEAARTGLEPPLCRAGAALLGRCPEEGMGVVVSQLLGAVVQLMQSISKSRTGWPSVVLPTFQLLNQPTAELVPQNQLWRVFENLPEGQVEKVARSLAKGTPDATVHLISHSFLWEPCSLVSKWTFELCRAVLCHGDASTLIRGLSHEQFAGPKQLAQGLAGWLRTDQRQIAAHAYMLLRFTLLGFQHSPALLEALAPALEAAVKAVATSTHCRHLHAPLQRLVESATYQHFRLSAGCGRVQGATPAVERLAASVQAMAARRPPYTLGAELLQTGWVHTRVSKPPGAVPAAPVFLRKEPKIFVGLSNLGNTCFLNAFLQALHATTVFREWLLCTDLQSCPAEHSGLLLALQKLHGSLVLSEALAISPVKLISALPAWDCIDTWRSRRQQQDAGEFGQLLLDSIDSALKALDRATSATAAAAAAVSGQPKVQFGKVVPSIFGGRLSNTVRCSQCQAASTSYEDADVLSLQLDIPAGGDGHAGASTPQPAASVASLPQMLQRYFASEPLDGGDGTPIYRCDSLRCAGALTLAAKRCGVVVPPAHLLLTLKRFRYDGTAAKICRRVALPLWLWLPLAVSAGTEAGPAGDPPEQQRHAEGEPEPEGASLLESGTAEPEPALEHRERYRLYAVVIHAGSSANSGHYYTYGRHLPHARPSSDAAGSAPALLQLHLRLWELAAQLDVPPAGGEASEQHAAAVALAVAAVTPARAEVDELLRRKDLPTTGPGRAGTLQRP